MAASPHHNGLEKVSVTVVSGFLGSGKTTLLRRIVADPEIGPRIAVIVNDIGELGLDPGLVREAGSTPTMRVTELVSGCICCTLQGELVSALRTLARGEGLPRRPEHIFIEPSGIARASEVSFSINSIGYEEPIETDAVITVVDAWNARRAHREHRELFEDQLRSADLVLLNKCDLVPDPADRAALQDFLRPLAPRATFLFCERAEVDPALLIGHIGQRQADAALAQAGPVQDLHDAHDAQDAHAGHAPGIGAVTLDVPFAVTRSALEDFLEGQGDRIFRIKGVVDAVWEDDAAPKPTLVQAVGDRIELDVLPEQSPLAAGKRWLIFIGAPKSLDRQLLQTALDELA